MIPIIEIGKVLVSADIITERFCCDIEKCKGECCVSGDAGAPVTLDEIVAIEGILDDVWSELTASAQTIIDRQGVAYIDREGDLVTSIVAGKDCVFTNHHDGCCFCTLEQAYRQGKTTFCKPVSCALYPIREVKIGSGVGLNYHRWDVCQTAVAEGQRRDIPLYHFLKEPLIRRFGDEWYNQLCTIADELKKHYHAMD